MKKVIIIIVAILTPVILIGGVVLFNYMRNRPIRVGYSKVNITPSYSVPLAGYGGSVNRMSTAVIDDIYVTCVSFTDTHNETALLINFDLIHMADDGNNIYSNLVKSFRKKYGIKKKNIIISATHTHTAPDIFSEHETIRNQYLPELYKKVNTCVKRAIADAKKTTSSSIHVGSVKVDNMAFVRRYYDEFGNFVGVNWSNPNPPVTHESEADNYLQVIRIKRKNKADVYLTNWAAHPDSVGGTQISSDYIGAFRAEVEKNLKAKFAFFQGASGNVNTRSMIDAESQYNLPTQTYGAKLAERLSEAINTNLLTRISNHGKISSTFVDQTVQYDSTQHENVEMGIEIFEKFTLGQIDIDTANAEAIKYGFSSVYECSKFRHILLFTNGVSTTLPLIAMSIGDIAFASAPYEMFCQTASRIRLASKAKSTFVVTHSNGSNSYIPTENVFENKGYEVAVCMFKKGTAEQLEAKFIEMINKHYTKKTA